MSKMDGIYCTQIKRNHLYYATVFRRSDVKKVDFTIWWSQGWTKYRTRSSYDWQFDSGHFVKFVWPLTAGWGDCLREGILIQVLWENELVPVKNGHLLRWLLKEGGCLGRFDCTNSLMPVLLVIKLGLWRPFCQSQHHIGSPKYFLFYFYEFVS